MATASVNLILSTFYKGMKDWVRRSYTSYLDVGTVYFYDTVDIEHPVIDVLDISSNDTDTHSNGNPRTDEWNYAELQFSNYKNISNRFYFIDRTEILSNYKVRLYLREDYLSTFYDDISTTSVMIERSSTKCTPTLNDPLALITGKPTFTFTPVTMPLSTVHTGFYVIGLTGCDEGDNASCLLFNRGSVNYFALPSEAMEDLIDKLQHLTGVVADQNPIDRIISVMYFPVPSSDSSVVTNITFYFNDADGNEANQTYAFYAHPLSNTDGVYISSDYAVTVPHHPDFDSTYKQYVDLPPYTKHILRAGMFGDIEIDNSLIESDDTYVQILYYQVQIDLATGQGLLKLGAGEGFRNEIAMVGINIPITQITSNSYLQVESLKNQYKSDLASLYAGVMGQQISGLGSAVNKNLIGSANAFTSFLTTDTFENIIYKNAQLSLYSAGLPTVTTKGASGSMLGCVDPWFLYSTFQTVIYPDYDKFGYPYHKVDTLTNHEGGFVQTTDAYFPVGIHLSEQHALEQLCNSGIYLNN